MDLLKYRLLGPAPRVPDTVVVELAQELALKFPGYVDAADGNGSPG